MNWRFPVHKEVHKEKMAFMNKEVGSHQTLNLPAP